VGPVNSSEGVGRTLKRAEQALLRAKSAALKPVGLSLAQYLALHELDQQPGITGASLARACLVTPQAMMIVLKSAEEQGLVARTPHPRHPNVLELRLTDPGREALHSARQRVEPIEGRIRAALSPREEQTLRALLDRFTRAIEAG
jgi:DNA-binding MarR family transcriptional regulator